MGEFRIQVEDKENRFIGKLFEQLWNREHSVDPGVFALQLVTSIENQKEFKKEHLYSQLPIYFKFYEIYYEGITTAIASHLYYLNKLPSEEIFRQVPLLL